MKILAIHDGHNATACYLKDGEIVSMVSEERFTNIKNQGGYPEKSINWIMSVNSMQFDSCDYIVFPHLVPPLVMTDVYTELPLKKKIFSIVNSMFSAFIVGSKKLITPYIKVLLRDTIKIRRKDVRNRMKNDGVETSVHYPPVHHFKIYQDYSCELPLTDQVASCEITLPMYSSLTDHQLDYIADSLLRAIK